MYTIPHLKNFVTSFQTSVKIFSKTKIRILCKLNNKSIKLAVGKLVKGIKSFIYEVVQKLGDSGMSQKLKCINQVGYIPHRKRKYSSVLK